MQGSWPSKPTSSTSLVTWPSVMNERAPVGERQQTWPWMNGCAIPRYVCLTAKKIVSLDIWGIAQRKWHVNYFVLKHNDWFMLLKQINNRMKAMTIFFLMLPVGFLWQSYISSGKFNLNTISQIGIPDIPHILAEIPFHCSSSSACLQSLRISSIPHFSWVQLYFINAGQIMLCQSTITSTNWTALF